MRILIADDHILVREGIVSLLEAAGHEVIGQAGTGVQAVEAAQSLQPDLVLLDLNMPVMDGMEALKHIKKKLPDIHVVILTVSDKETDLLTAVQAGASGYLLKDLNLQGFIDNLSRLEKGEYAIASKDTANLIRGLINSIDKDTSRSAALTSRETEILYHISNGLSNKAIALTLSLSTSTIKYHVKKILQKLGVNNRAEAVALALREKLFDRF